MDKEAIYKQYHQKLLILIRIKINYHPDSEDICQDVMEAVMLAVEDGKIDNPEKLPAFINRICSNKITDWIRRKYVRKESELKLPSRESEIDQSALDKLINDEERNHLYGALKKLNLRERKILFLHYYYDWGFDEIARFMKLKPSTVRKIAERTRNKIAQRFEINY